LDSLRATGIQPRGPPGREAVTCRAAVDGWGLCPRRLPSRSGAWSWQRRRARRSS